MVTYSKANTIVFDREKFSFAIVQSFQSATRSVVLHWAYCLEQHKNGCYHFHIAVLLDRAQRWMKVKICIKDNYNIIVKFSGHPGYYSAYTYVTKEDKAVVRSPNHPTRIVEPRTASAIRARAGKGRKKWKRMPSTEVANIVLQQEIHGRLELLAHANSRTQQGDSRLCDFVLNRY